MSEVEEDKLAQLCFDNPIYFIEDYLNSKIWSKQKDIVASVQKNKYTTVKSCHGSGKSYDSARIVLWFLYTHNNSTVITTAPTFRQVKSILWKEIRSAHSNSKHNLGGSLLDTKININPDWFALGLSTKEPDKFQGFHSKHILVVVDEAGVSEEIFEAIDGILTSENPRLLLIGNPTSVSGRFYESFKKENFSKISISVFDTPNFTKFGITLDDIRKNTWKQKITKDIPFPMLVTPEWVADRFTDWGENSPMFEARVLGRFPVISDDTLIALQYIENAVIRSLEPRKDDEVVLGVDVARFGRDKTIFIKKKGNKVLYINKFSKEDTMRTAGRIIAEIKKENKLVVNIDEIGVGGGVVDRVKEQGYNVNGINVGETIDDDQFLNKKAKYYFDLKKRFETGTIDIPNDEELISQLSAIKFEYHSDGRIKIESKDKIAKRGLKSPDCAEALMLAFIEKKIYTLSDEIAKLANKKDRPITSGLRDTTF